MDTFLILLESNFWLVSLETSSSYTLNKIMSQGFQQNKMNT